MGAARKKLTLDNAAKLVGKRGATKPKRAIKGSTPGKTVIAPKNKGLQKGCSKETRGATMKKRPSGAVNAFKSSVRNRNYSSLYHFHVRAQMRLGKPKHVAQKIGREKARSAMA